MKTASVISAVAVLATATPAFAQDNDTALHDILYAAERPERVSYSERTSWERMAGATSWDRRAQVGLWFKVTAKGRVKNCVVTRSTGSQALDDLSCRAIKREARLEPARNAAGKPVASTARLDHDWRPVFICVTGMEEFEGETPR